jgi:outer membrane biosynthesis protein TonB
LGRHWIKLIVAVMVCGAGGFLLLKQPSGPKTTPRKAVEPTMVRVQLPPPPPPPPKVLPPPPPEQKMVEQKAVTADEKPADKPKDEPPKAKDEPPALGTNIRGNGPGDGFGLGSSGNGGRIGGNGSAAGASRFGWYAGQVQSRLQQALERNPKTRKASFNRLTAKIWVDASGRITRAKVSPSSGDPAIDSAIEQEALVGQQLTEPPPAGMLMPINLRLTARRP